MIFNAISTAVKTAMDETNLARMYLQLPLRQWGAGDVYLQLEEKHGQKTHCCNGVVDTFGPRAF